MPVPLDVSGLSFRAGPGLGLAARVFYSAKQLKTTFRTGPGLGLAASVFYSVKQQKTAFGPASGQKKFAGFKISSAHARLVRFVGGPGQPAVTPDFR
jgi:hypothetical protein